MSSVEPRFSKLTDVPIPEPGMGEIVVRVHAAGVNPVDRNGPQSGVFVGELPFVLGWDVSGTVETVGLGVTITSPATRCSECCPSRTGMVPTPSTSSRRPAYRPKAGPS